jgi:hypothetical protein
MSAHASQIGAECRRRAECNCDASGIPPGAPKWMEIWFIFETWRNVLGLRLLGTNSRSARRGQIHGTQHTHLGARVREKERDTAVLRFAHCPWHLCNMLLPALRVRACGVGWLVGWPLSWPLRIDQWLELACLDFDILSKRDAVPILVGVICNLRRCNEFKFRICRQKVPEISSFNEVLIN